MRVNEITQMPIEERLALMEELWVSFERENLEHPTPAWHQEVLIERERKKEKKFIPLDEVKQNLREALRAYRDS